jgi:hypothetical protein
MPHRPIPHDCSTPDKAFVPGDVAVIMIFKTPVLLSIEGKDQVTPVKRIFYPEGVHDVPERLADHWWFKANGVIHRPSAPTLTAGVLKPSTAGEAAPVQPSKAKSVKR